FDEVFVFGAARNGELAAADWGVTAATNDSTLEVDFHARRTLVAVTGAGVQRSALAVDVGGLYVELNDRGTVLAPEDNPFQVGADGALPGVTVSKFRLAAAAAGPPTVDTVTGRSAP